MKSQAAIELPASSPASTSISAAGRKYAHMNSSARVHCSATGRPAAFARRAASTAASPVCLPPKPPPKCGTITRTRSGGTRKASAICCRTLKGLLVPVHTVTRPSCHSATAARGSMGACCT